MTVHLHTILQYRQDTGRTSQLTLNLPDGSLISDVLLLLEIRHPLDALLLVVNTRLVEADQSLQDGDDLHLIPAMSGGQFHSPGVPPQSTKSLGTFQS